MRSQIIAAAGAVTLVVAGAAFGRSTGAVTFELKTTNHSGITGTGTLTPTGEKAFQVKLVLRGPKAKLTGYFSAHIHNVTCAKYATIPNTTAQYATVVDGLSNVQHGTSLSTVSSPITQRTTGAYAINVHLPSFPWPTIVCGDIPKRG